MIVAEPEQRAMRLVFCQNKQCRKPIARVLLEKGSQVEVRCRACGVKTLIEPPQRAA
jgi:hypothetical protein